MKKISVKESPVTCHETMNAVSQHNEGGQYSVQLYDQWPALRKRPRFIRVMRK